MAKHAHEEVNILGTAVVGDPEARCVICQTKIGCTWYMYQLCNYHVALNPKMYVEKPNGISAKLDSSIPTGIPRKFR